LDLKTAKETEMKLIKRTLILALMVVACSPVEFPTDIVNGISNPDYGTIEFDFVLPNVKLPEQKIHRVNLSLARSLDSLYRKSFCSAANVSDFKQKYSFSLLPGRYFYQAGVTCSCGGDSCLYGGFPGGQLSIWWTSGWVDVEKGKVFSQKLNFQ
jgi:hypothetical protein